MGPLLVAQTRSPSCRCRTCCFSTFLPYGPVDRLVHKQPYCPRKLLILLVNIKCISPRPHSSRRMPLSHQSGAALRPWPLSQLPNLSGFTLLLGWVSSAPLRPARTLKRQVDIRTSRPHRSSYFSCKSLWSQPRASRSVEPPCSSSFSELSSTLPSPARS